MANKFQKNNWQTKKLGEVCDIKTGKKDVNQGNPSGQYPFFTCAREHTFSDTYSFDTTALLIAGNGDVGHVSFFEGKFEAYQRTYVLTNFVDVLPRFLFLILSGPLKDDVSKQKLGGTMPYIKLGMLTEFKVPVPPINEQKRIVKVLDEAFENIEKAKKNTEKNLQNAKELFDSYLENIYSHPTNQEKRIGDVCLGTLNIKWDVNSSFQYIDLTSVDRSTHKITNSVLVDSKNAPSRAKKVIKKSDVIFGTTRPTLNRVALVSAEFDGQICSTGFVVLRADQKIIAPKIIYYYLQTKRFIERMEKIQKGASYPAVTDNEVKNENIYYPLEISRQMEVVNDLDVLYEQTKRLEAIYQQKQADLEELKKSILQKVFKGEL